MSIGPDAQEPNIVSLHKHFDDLFGMYDRLIDERFKLATQRFDAMDKALELAWSQLGDWKAGANEWRATLADMSARFVLKETMERTVTEVEELRRWRAQMQGLAMASGLLAVAATILAIVSIFR